MPQTEQSQYATFVAPRLDSIDDNIAKIFDLLEGNGQVGIKGRLLLVEVQQETTRGRWKWIFGIIAVLVAAGIWDFAGALFGRFTVGH